MLDDGQILLTADSTLMSDHHGNVFMGFGACAPSYVLPHWFYRFIFFPPMRTVQGHPWCAPYGLRKVESAMLDANLPVEVVRPQDLHHHLDGCEALGVSTMDPLGMGPASTTFAGSLNCGLPNSALHFQQLLLDPAVVRARRRGMKVIVGGPGTWQLLQRDDERRRLGIDCVVDGRFTSEVAELFRSAMQGDALPKHLITSRKARADDLPPIRRPSVNGLVEIGQGCVRGCDFCRVTGQPLCWMPIDYIQREVEMNARWGVVDKAMLHAEDVLLYGSRNLLPRGDKLLPMLEMVKQRVSKVQWSHVSIAAINAAPKLMEECAEIITDEHQAGWSAEIGIETGSARLLAEAMPAKAKPFKPEQWPEMVLSAAGLMSDLNVVPSCTLICGLPQETDDDVLRTIELLDELKDFRSLIVPLFFVPLGNLSNGEYFRFEDLTPNQVELLEMCIRQGVTNAKGLINDKVVHRWYGPAVDPLYHVFLWAIEQKVKEASLS